MEYVRVNNLQVGDIVAKTIYNDKLQIMLRAGNKLTDAGIRAIKEQGYKGIYLEMDSDSRRENIPLPLPLIDDEEILQLVAIMKEASSNPDVFNDPFNANFKKYRNILEMAIDNLIKEIKFREANGEFIYEMEDNRTVKNWIFYHSLNTCVISAGIALKMGFNDTEIKNIAVAGLYHDFGKILLSPELRNSKDISEEDKEIIRQHPEKAFRLFQRLSYPVSTCYGIWQHHEKIDGSGYPKGICADKITVSAQIVALASAFDNLVNIQPYNDNPMSHSEALEYIQGCGLYKIDCIMALLKFIVPYPVGTKVKLSTGEIGIVLKNNSSLVMRPFVIVGKKVYDLKSDFDCMHITILDEKVA